MLPPQPDNYSVSSVNLDRTACLSIGQHRVDRIGWSTTLGREHNFGHVLFELSAFGTRYGGALTNNLESHLAQCFFTHYTSRLQQ